MDARAKTIREILYAGDQYLVPFFQRQYSWTHRHWERLREDVWSLLGDLSDSKHFMGPLVCTPVNQVPGKVPTYQLIDGQQRLTTLTLMLTALRDIAVTHGLKDLSDEITEDYLVHKRKPGLERYKIIPRTGDRETLIALVDGKDARDHRRRGIYRAWHYFQKQIRSLSDKGGDSVLKEIFSVVTDRLSLVVITVDGENPYEIFESLNSTGLPLEESDLIRNYLFMQVPLREQDEFNIEHWQPFERLFEETEQDPAINPTGFYRSFLMRDGQYSKAKATFLDFKEQSRKSGLSPRDHVALLQQFARYEVLLRRPHTARTQELRAMFAQLKALEITTAHPLIMHLMALLDRGELDEAMLLGCLSDLASFVLRRSICGESTRAYGMWFVEAITEIQANPRENLRQYWLRRGWPDDTTFAARLLEFPLYRRETNKCRLMLQALEESIGHKEKVNLMGLEIEHVMPQKLGQGARAKEWRDTLGENWKTVHETWLHTLGNLTLSGYNENLGNRPYLEKQEKLRDSKLGLNAYFAKVERWDAKAIQERGHQLSGKVVKLWPRPEGGPKYRPVMEEPEDAAIDPEERDELLYEFWEGLVAKVASVGNFHKLPDATTHTRLRFVIGRSGFSLRVFFDVEKSAIDVALRCDGANARERYEQFYGERESIERELGDDLIWQVKAGVNRAYIISRLHDVNLSSKTSWEDYRSVIVEKMQAFRRVFDDKIRDARSALG